MEQLAVWPPRERGGRTAGWWPWLLVAAAVGWNLVSLRALTLRVAYLNDNSLHEQMVRFATAQLRAGHLPLSSWFPFLGEGSPQFLHYQSLPAILTGAAGLLTGPDVAFRWSLYLLLVAVADQRLPRPPGCSGRAGWRRLLRPQWPRFW